MTADDAKELLAMREEVALFADDLDKAFVGLGYQFTRPLTVYSRRKVLRVLRSWGMSEDEAVEYFDFNIAGGYVGEQTPVFLDD